MYGIVNKACEALIKQHFGDETWDNILIKIQSDDQVFIGMQQYPDDVTYNIVSAASDITHIPANELLKRIGEYWVQYTSTGDYRDIFINTGNDLTTFLENLDNMHTRVGMIMPDLKPPSFSCKGSIESGLELSYYSHRNGLAPMVIGLIHGLGDYFNLHLNVEHTMQKNEENDHDVFIIKHQK